MSALRRNVLESGSFQICRGTYLEQVIVLAATESCFGVEFDCAAVLVETLLVFVGARANTK
jgi:hypothetical protein